MARRRSRRRTSTRSPATGFASTASSPRRCRRCRPGARSSRAAASSPSVAGSERPTSGADRARRRSGTSARPSPSALRRAGYWTGSVSDNPFVGFTKSWRPFRLSFDRYVSVGRPQRVPRRAGRRHRRAARALAPRGAQRGRPLRRGHAQVPRQHRQRRGRLRVECRARLRRGGEAARGGRGQPAVRARGGLVRPARALEPDAGVHRPLRVAELRRARTPAPPATRAGRATSRRTSCARCAPCTRPR